MVWLTGFRREGETEIYTFTDGTTVRFNVATSKTVVKRGGEKVWEGDLAKDRDLVEFRRMFDDVIKTIYMQFENPEATGFRKAVGRVVKSFVAMLLKGCDCGGEAS